jgi:ribosome assembly protein 4
VGATREQLENLLNNLLRNEEKLPYSFFLDDSEIVESLAASLAEHEAPASETVLAIVYQPQAVFRVQVVTRCSSTLPGHSEAILHVHFSPDGKRLASASGDGTVRLWELGSQMPERTLSGHRNWVLAVAWAPNARKLASGSMDGDIRVWDPDSGKELCRTLRGHAKWVTSLSWEPFHRDPESRLLASSSKDGTIRVSAASEAVSEQRLNARDCADLGHGSQRHGVVWHCAHSSRELRAVGRRGLHLLGLAGSLHHHVGGGNRCACACARRRRDPHAEV